MISVQGLTKEFAINRRSPGLAAAVKSLFLRHKEIKTAVNRISFDIPEGEMVGYIGANGAGKSTTIKMMAGILTPTSGVCTVNGLVPHENRRLNAMHIGVVFGQRTQLWWDLPLSETFLLLRDMYSVSEADYRSRMAFFQEVLNLGEFIDQPVRTLSLGQRMRADLAAALIHNPRVLFLDEPTIGLDVVVKENIRRAIKEINRNYRTTIILTTHDISDIEELCSRIIIIDRGSILYDGGIEAIRDRFGFMRTLEIDCKGSPEISNSELRSEFPLDESDLGVSSDGSKLTVRYNRKKTSFDRLTAFIFARVQVSDMKIHETRIEEIVKKIYRDASAGSGDDLAETVGTAAG